MILYSSPPGSHLFLFGTDSGQFVGVANNRCIGRNYYRWPVNLIAFSGEYVDHQELPDTVRFRLSFHPVCHVAWFHAPSMTQSRLSAPRRTMSGGCRLAGQSGWVSTLRWQVRSTVSIAEINTCLTQATLAHCHLWITQSCRVGRTPLLGDAVVVHFAYERQRWRMERGGKQSIAALLYTNYSRMAKAVAYKHGPPFQIASKYHVPTSEMDSHTWRRNLDGGGTHRRRPGVDI
jgi:hypothetical protein